MGWTEQVDDESVTVDDQPASLHFSGVGKLITIQNPFPTDSGGVAPSDKSEITCLTFMLNTEEELKRLVAGDRVALVHEEENRR